MPDIQFKSLHGDTVLLESKILEELEASLRGRMLRPESGEYEQSRKVWNGMIDHKPALVVRCAGASDVIKVIVFSRKHNLLVSVKCGGHNFGGLSVCQGG